MERGSFHNHRRIFGVWPGVEIAFSVSLFGANQNHVWNQINQQPRIQFDVSVDRADFQLAIFQKLRNPQALWAGKGEIYFLCYAQLKQREMFRPADARYDQVQVAELIRIGFHQRTRKEICLLLVVALEDNSITADNQGLERFDDLRRR